MHITIHSDARELRLVRARRGVAGLALLLLCSPLLGLAAWLLLRMPEAADLAPLLGAQAVAAVALLIPAVLLARVLLGDATTGLAGRLVGLATRRMPAAEPLVVRRTEAGCEIAGATTTRALTAPLQLSLTRHLEAEDDDLPAGHVYRVAISGAEGTATLRDGGEHGRARALALQLAELLGCPLTDAHLDAACERRPVAAAPEPGRMPEALERMLRRDGDTFRFRTPWATRGGVLFGALCCAGHWIGLSVVFLDPQYTQPWAPWGAAVAAFGTIAMLVGFALSLRDDRLVVGPATTTVGSLTFGGRLPTADISEVVAEGLGREIGGRLTLIGAHGTLHVDPQGGVQPDEQRWLLDAVAHAVAAASGRA